MRLVSTQYTIDKKSLEFYISGCKVHPCIGCIAIDYEHKIDIITEKKLSTKIENGDILFSPYGKTKVKSIIYDIKECYKIELENETILVVGEDHPFIIDNKKILAKTLKKGDYLVKWIK